jgi:hypothetical protein
MRTLAQMQLKQSKEARDKVEDTFDLGGMDDDERDDGEIVEDSQEEVEEEGGEEEDGAGGEAEGKRRS